MNGQKEDENAFKESFVVCMCVCLCEHAELACASSKNGPDKCGKIQIYAMGDD